MKISELYKFVLSDTTWNKTSGNLDVTYNNEKYSVSAGLKRTESNSRSEISKANIEVEINIYDEISTNIFSGFLENVLYLTIYSYDHDTSTANVIWKGRLVSNKPVGENLKLIFESIFTSLRRPGLRRRFQKNCPYALYGTGCNKNKEQVKILGTVTDVSSNVITVTEAASYSDGYFIGGMLQFGGYFGFIIDHVESVITLQRPIDSLVDGYGSTAGYGYNYGRYYGSSSYVHLYPGCNHLTDDCKNVHDNLINYGGQPWIPSRNPNDGSSII